MCHIRLSDLQPSCHAVNVMKLTWLPANSTEVCQGALEAMISGRKNESVCLSVCPSKNMLNLSPTPFVPLMRNYWLLPLFTKSLTFLFNSQMLYTSI